MKLTAHDLKRLKEGNHFIECTHLGKRCGIKLEAILARMTAAEKALIHHQITNGGCACDYCNTWRESKGE